MKAGDEYVFSVAKGKEYYVRLPSIDNYDEDMESRQVTLEVNGERLFMRTPDDVMPLLSVGGVGGKTRREKCDPTDKGSIGCPMPGIVVKVNVSEGDTVEEGQGLFVLSAMKIETEIKTPISGKVTKVLVESGDNVEGDDLLGVIEA